MAAKKRPPKYIEVKEDIKALFYSEDYSTGDRLPTETELCNILNASKVTIHQALKELQSEGFIERKRGFGTTFINKKKKYDFMMSKIGRLMDVIDGNPEIATKMLKIIEKKANKKIAERLQIDLGDIVVEYSRVRTIDNTPAVYSIDNISKKRIPEGSSFENMGPSLSQAIGVNLHHSKAKMIPVKSNKIISELLSIPYDSQCLLLEEVTYDVEGKPLDYSYEYYPEYLFNFNLLREKL